MNRRFFLQAGGATALALLTHSCRRSPATSVYRSSLKAIKARGYMVVATENHYPPFEFLVNDRPTGYDHDLLELLRKVAPFEIRQEILPWQEILPGVESGRFDLALSAVGINDAQPLFLKLGHLACAADRYQELIEEGQQICISLANGPGGVGAAPHAIAHLKEIELFVYQDGQRDNIMENRVDLAMN